MTFLSYRFAPFMRSLIVATMVLATLITRSEPLAAPATQLSSDGNRVQYHPSPRVRVVPDIMFARYGKRALRLDLYLPIVNKAAVPGVIVIRGGGWTVNDKGESAHVASALAERGVAAASIEYRTAHEAPFPGAVQDVKAAVRWMRANAKLYGISSDAIGTLGGSSGAHMALLAGLSNDRDLEGSGGNNNVSSRVQAVVAMATPTDLRRLNAGGRKIVERFLHASPTQNPKLWARASPVNHVSAGGPSVLLIHGTADESVLPEQSSRFAELYRKVGGQVELVLIPKAPHPFWNYIPWFDDTMNRAAAFFHRVASKLSESQSSRSDFQKLRWLEGAWRGSDGGQNAFYESYHFVSDTTIEIQYFGKDETLSQIKRKGSVSLVNGTILHRDESGVWAATSIDDKSVHFAPRENADNSFSWEQESPDLWLARLEIPDPQGKQNEKVYRMDRVKH
jgi:acetyl esterase/lipase